MPPTGILSVAEKPSVAKKLAEIIWKDKNPPGSQPSSRRGRSQYNPLWDIPNCSFGGSDGYKMTITSVSGHLCETDFPPEYKNWTAFSPLVCFEAPVIKQVPEKNENMKRALEEEARKCKILFLWLDCDLEGEAIAYEVMSVCKAVNPTIDVWRARFSALIPRDVLRTIRHPERPNSNMNDAVETRQEIDLRIGAAFTRFQTLLLSKRFAALSNQTISYGPCQFPTFGFVVDRFLKVESFVPEEFWAITCECEVNDPEESNGKLTTTFRWDRVRLFDRFAVTVLYESCLEDGPNGEAGGMARVTHRDARPTTKGRPVPLNTVSLQMKASKYFRLGAEETMQIAEKLYMDGAISYPRTETEKFKAGTELLPLIYTQKTHPLWGAFASQLLGGDQYNPGQPQQQLDAGGGERSGWTWSYSHISMAQRWQRGR